MSKYPSVETTPKREGSQTASARYRALEPNRKFFLDRARVCAALTIPSLLPPEGHHSSATLYEPYQDIGARGVVYLSSKLLSSLYPPGMPSFKMEIPAETLMASGQPTTPPEIDSDLVMMEKIIRGEIERKDWRTPTNVGLQHLITTGNVGEMMMMDNTIKPYRLDQYVVVRDPAGRLIEFVICEKFTKDSIPDSLKSLSGPQEEPQDKYELYTWGVRRPDHTGWDIHQEIGDAMIPDSKGFYKVSPFNALRWTAVLGESYGRGKVEEHLPALRQCEALSQSMTEGGAMAARNITMVRPNAQGGINLRRRLAKADNGEVITGNPEDVQMFQFTNTSGLQVVQRQLEEVTRELMASFLMHSAAQRDGERVTAYELRMVVEELEGTLGGVYSTLSQELQQHRLARLILQMQGAQQLPPFDPSLAEPVVLTGLEALGRQGDVSKVAQALQLLAQVPPEFLGRVKQEVLLQKAFNGLDLADAVMSDEEFQMAQQQQMMQQAASGALEAGGQQAAVNVANQATGIPQQ